MEVGAMNTAANVAAQYAKAPREATPQPRSVENARPAEAMANTRANEVRANELRPRVSEMRANEAPPKPVVNAQGQTTGRIINTSA